MHRYSSPSSPSTRYTNRHGKTTMEGWKAESGLCQSQEQTITHCPIKSLSPRLVSEAQLEGTSHRSSCGPSMPPGIGESSSKEREEGGMGNETGRGGTGRDGEACVPHERRVPPSLSISQRARLSSSFCILFFEP